MVEPAVEPAVSPLLVRPATTADLTEVKAVYDEQVRTAVSTFDLEPPPLDYWERRLASTETGDHLLVAVSEGRVVGHACSSSFRPRPAYRHTRETSVYVDPGSQSRGVGRALYDELLGSLRHDGVRSAVAVVALPNPGSRALHRACGFEPVGVLREVGRKLDRWVDTEWWQLLLDDA